MMSPQVKFSDLAPVDPRAKGNQPQSVEIKLRDWGLGGFRQTVELTLWEAIQLRDELNKMFKP